MTTNMQQGTLLDVLKKKMRQTKEEMEKYKDECEEYQKRLQGEVIRREEVSFFHSFSICFFCFVFISEQSFVQLLKFINQFDPKATNDFFLLSQASVYCFS